MNWESWFYGVVIGMWLAILIRDLGNWWRRKRND